MTSLTDALRVAPRTRVRPAARGTALLLALPLLALALTPSAQAGGCTGEPGATAAETCTAFALANPPGNPDRPAAPARRLAPGLARAPVPGQTAMVTGPSTATPLGLAAAPRELAAPRSPEAVPRLPYAP